MTHVARLLDDAAKQLMAAGNKDEYRSTLAATLRAGRSRSVSGGGAEVEEADLTTKGILYSLARSGNVYRRVALPFGTATGMAMTKFAGTTVSSGHVATGVAFAVTGAPTQTSGNGVHGTARRATRTDTAYIAHNMTFTLAFMLRQCGFYVAAKILAPTTANQADFNDRGIRFGVYQTLPVGISADPAASFVEWKYREATDTTWEFRCSDGASVTEATDVAPALGQPYMLEIWTPGNSGNVYGCINGGTIRELSATLPGATTNLTTLHIGHKQDVDNGDTVLDLYWMGAIPL